MHQCLGVILKPTQNLKDVLAPYVRSEENQNGFMDYYYIGNKWANSLRLKPGGKEIYLEGPMSDHIISEIESTVKKAMRTWPKSEISISVPTRR